MTTTSTSTPELEPRYAAIIRETLPVIGARIDDITSTFYRRLFAAHPDLLRNRFNRGNQVQHTQQRALAASIATFAAHLVDPDLPEPREMLARIGNQHASLGVTAAEYRTVHEHLFAAIVEVLGPQTVTAEVAAAWDRVYWLMAETLVALERGLYDRAGVEPADVFRESRVVQRIEDPSGVVTFVVESADPDLSLPEFLPGQYISVEANLPDGARQLRQYSLVDRSGTGQLAFTVRRVAAHDGLPEGEVSSWLHATVRVGDRLRVTVPFGDLTLDTTDTAPVVLISAGIGVTPMIGILHHLAAADRNRPVLLLHADRSPDTHPLREVLRELLAELPNADLEVWYEQEPGTAHHGRMDLSAVGLPEAAQYYLCGGSAFLQDVRAQLRAAQIPDTRLHFELFAPNDWLLDAAQS